MQIIAPYAHFDIPRIGQSYVLFRCNIPTVIAISSKLGDYTIHLYYLKDKPAVLASTRPTRAVLIL